MRPGAGAFGVVDEVAGVSIGSGSFFPSKGQRRFFFQQRFDGQIELAAFGCDRLGGRRGGRERGQVVGRCSILGCEKREEEEEKAEAEKSRGREE